MLISDVIMTGMTGSEAAIITRSKLPKCKILLFSGQAATADLLEKARAQGHEFEILAKPVHPTDLLAKLRGWCLVEATTKCHYLSELKMLLARSRILGFKLLPFLNFDCRDTCIHCPW